LNRKSPDFVCLLGGQPTAVGVKNLRIHRFAEKAMLDHYYDIALKRGVNGLQSQAALVARGSNTSFRKP